MGRLGAALLAIGASRILQFNDLPSGVPEPLQGFIRWHRVLGSFGGWHQPCHCEPGGTSGHSIETGAPQRATLLPPDSNPTMVRGPLPAWIVRSLEAIGLCPRSRDLQEAICFSRYILPPLR